MRSGRVSTSRSLQPSRSAPPKSSGPMAWSCTQVPNAPSKIRTRSASESRNSDISLQGTGAVARTSALPGCVNRHRGEHVGRSAPRGRPAPRAPDRRSCRRTRTRRRARSRSRPAASQRSSRRTFSGPRTFATGQLAGEDAVGADLELGGEHAVELQRLGDRAQIRRERGGHDHEPVTLGAVPVGPFDRSARRCRAVTSAAYVVRERVDRAGVASCEQLVDDLRFQRIAGP